MGKNINAPKWLKAFLHSFAQVVFLENIISGLLIIAGITVFAVEQENPHIIILPIIAAIIGNIFAKILENDENAIVSGLFGFSPVLIGLGAITFFPTVDAYIVTILGSFLVIPLTTVINGLTSRVGLPGFTMPFIAVTWFFMLVSYNTNLLNTGKAGALAATAVLENGVLEWKNLLSKGFGEIYLLDTVIGSLLIFAAFVVDRFELLIKLAVVVLFSIAMGVIFKVDTGKLNMGLYTYNSILVYMALETFSPNTKKYGKFYLLAFMSLVLVALVDYALPAIMSPFGLPSLTFPFVAVGWAMLYFEKNNKFYNAEK